MIDIDRAPSWVETQHKLEVIVSTVLKNKDITVFKITYGVKNELKEQPISHNEKCGISMICFLQIVYHAEDLEVVALEGSIETIKTELTNKFGIVWQF